jgi:hypothetical protein
MPPAPADQPAEVVTVWSRGPSVDDASPTASAASTPRLDPEPVHRTAEPPVRPVRAARPEVRRPAAALAGATVIVLLGALVWALGVVGGDEPAPVLASDTAVTLGSTSPTWSVPARSSTGPSTSSVPTSAPTTTTTSAPTTTSTTTTSTSTTSTTTTSTTTSTTTTSTTTTTTPVAEVHDATGPRVTIVGRVGPCTFGDDCLIADFTIEAFPSPQDEFVCEFENGSRYTFRFGGGGAERACATSSDGGTITIEVGGVRSETITR